jgi:hypothetical protein
VRRDGGRWCLPAGWCACSLRSHTTRCALTPNASLLCQPLLLRPRGRARAVFKGGTAQVRVLRRWTPTLGLESRCLESNPRQQQYWLLKCLYKGGRGHFFAACGVATLSTGAQPKLN